MIQLFILCGFVNDVTYQKCAIIFLKKLKITFTDQIHIIDKGISLKQSVEQKVVNFENEIKISDFLTFSFQV